MPHHRLLGPLVAVLLLVPVAPALAGPTVSVRVEGQNATLLPATTVTLPDAKAPGNPCTGPTAARTKAAALEEATQGNWDRQPFTLTILGESHTFTANDYWSVWFNEKVGNGICSDQDLLQDGDRVLFLTDVSGPSFEPTVFPMTLAAPATVAPGAAFSVTATEYRSQTGNPGEGTPTPAAGVQVSGGAATTTTGDDGRAAVRLDQRGPATLRAARANGSRTSPVSVCVTDGADGFCGTTRPGEAPGPAAAPPPPPSTAADTVAAFAKIATTEGRRYAKGRGPRVLRGVVDADAAGIADVRLRLSRTDGPRCSRFDGVRERFVTTTRCGITKARTFSVGGSARFEYALPGALPRGRYVLDAVVADRAGNRTTTYQRGRNRVVFFVG